MVLLALVISINFPKGIEMYRFFRSKHGARWFVFDQFFGILVFITVWLLTPLTDSIPQPYYLCIVGWCWGVILAFSARICGLPNSGTHYGVFHYEIIAISIISVILSFLFFNTIVGILLNRSYDLFIMMGMVLLSIFGMSLSRIIAFKATRNTPKRLLLIGSKNEIEDFLKEAQTLRSIQIVSYFGPETLIKSQKEELQFIERLTIQVLKKNQIDTLVILPTKHTLINEQMIFEISSNNISILTSGLFFKKYCRKIIPEFMSSSELLSLDLVSENKSALHIKRLLELAITLLVLVTTLPIFPIVALLIKLTSKGPAFYRQQREGVQGKKFNIIKFRTMINNAEVNGAQWAMDNDNRITRLGSFLRKTRIDELPQLFNILKGEMSLIGPRPERPEFTSELKKNIPFYTHRALLPPGLTGWAQIMYKYGSSEEDAQKKLQYDLYYISNFSIAFDLEILLKTVPLLMKGSR